MIPSFKTYLKESVWMDIHKQSVGDIDRREDNAVNFMKTEAFMKYLYEYYECDHGIITHIGPPLDEITVQVLRPANNYGFYVYASIYNKQGEDAYVTLPCRLFVYRDTDNGDDYLKKTLLDNFNVKLTTNEPDIARERYVKIYPKDDKPVNNLFFINVLNIILSAAGRNFRKELIPKLTESVWMDIHKQSNGDIERKENDLNRLDMDEFYSYLNKIYVTIPNNYEPGGTFLLKHKKFDNISMLIFTDSNNDIYRLTFNKFSDKDRFISLPLSDNILKDQLYEKLTDNYSIKEITKPDNESLIYIYPKNDGEINNAFFAELIEFILENLGSRLTKLIKKVI